MVIGSDLICCKENALGVVRALRSLLRGPGSHALLVNPSAHSRWAIGAFQDALHGRDSGLLASISRIHRDSPLLEGVHDKAEVEYELYHITPVPAEL